MCLSKSSEKCPHNAENHHLRQEPCIVCRANRILMVKHRVENQEWWCLPGGGLEGKETPANGALRELREECNVRGTLIRQTSHITYAPDD
ncbi:MAG: NUDIX hydrolase, partial [Alphaproteobacteria bacterium]|nr:NUDIX hydrolase [Alphaproteobacteria bacterium]